MSGVAAATDSRSYAMTPDSPAPDVPPATGLTECRGAPAARQGWSEHNTRHDAASHSQGVGQVLGACSVDARGGDRAQARPRQVRRGLDHRGAPGLQRCSWVPSGREGAGDSRRAEITARTERVGASGRCLGERGRLRACSRRHGETFGRRRGGRGRAHHRRRGSARSVHAHRRIHTRRGRPGPSDICGRVGAPRRGCGGGHRDRTANEIRADRGTGPHGTR